MEFLITYNGVPLNQLNGAEKMLIEIESSAVVNFVKQDFDHFNELMKIQFEGPFNNLQRLISFAGGGTAVREALLPALARNGFQNYIPYYPTL